MLIYTFLDCHAGLAGGTPKAGEVALSILIFDEILSQPYKPNQTLNTLLKRNLKIKPSFSKQLQFRFRFYILRFQETGYRYFRDTGAYS